MLNNLPPVAVVLPKISGSISDINLARYFKSIINAGGFPFALPMTKDPQVLEFMLSGAKGLLITGGMDLNPKTYGSDVETNFNVDYDEHCFLVFDIAMKLELPIFGICRGEQLMNVAMGGTLIPDIPNHRNTFHEITGISGKLAQALKVESFTVNSFHHQVVDKVAPNFVVTARSAEGFVEAIEDPTKPYLVGVQWHPERHEFKDVAPLFNGFIEACKNYRKG